jgi:hypothetical protein
VSNRIRLFSPLLALAVLACLAGGCDGRSPSLLLDLSGAAVDPFELAGDRVAAFLFVGTECPVSNRYAPEIQRLQDEFEPRGVAFFLVYPDPAADADAIRRHLAEFGHRAPALRDPEHALVARAGVGTTPEAAVFDSSGQLRYAGRIDDRYVTFGVTRPAPTTRDLERALEATLAGEEPDPAAGPPVGCHIADLR